jgi:hypothetical protein
METGTVPVRGVVFVVAGDDKHALEPSRLRRQECEVVLLLCPALVHTTDSVCTQKPAVFVSCVSCVVCAPVCVVCLCVVAGVLTSLACVPRAVPANKK